MGQRRVRDAAGVDRRAQAARQLRGRPDGRSIEIQRLIGRSLRAIVDLEALGERTVWVDCDVLQADGGTRCASICGGYVALHRALSGLVDAGKLAELPLTAGVAAVSCGIVEGEAVLDLDYKEDSSAEVDLNVVMTSGGRLVEVQGTAEGQPFDRAQLDRLLELGAVGMANIEAAQLRAVAAPDEPAARGACHGERRQGRRAVAPARPRGRGARDRGRGERRQTYAGNALLKARAALAAADGRIGLGDDSGIEVTALGGEPGLHSARWEGPGDADRNTALLARLTGTADRSAAFVCALAAILPDGREIVVEGRVDGVIARGPARRGRLRLRPPLRAARGHAHGRRAQPRRRRTSSRTAGAPRAPSRPRLQRPASREPGRPARAVRRGAAARRRRASAGRRAARGEITVLDRELGLVAVRLPKRGVAASLRRLRAAPGVRYVERDAPVSLAGEGCDIVGRDNSPKDPNWRAAIHLSTRSAAGMLIGIADSGVDDDRLAPRQAPALYLALGGPKLPRDPLGHGTAVASLLVANRPDVGVVGIVPDATLLSARIIRRGAGCSEHVLEDGLVRALGWLRRQGAQVVNVSATAQRTHALVESLRALELSGALVVAAVGNGGAIAAPDKFPASEPGVLGVGALSPRSSTQVDKSRRTARRWISWRPRRASRSSRRAPS